jgi:hypothetical protein
MQVIAFSQLLLVAGSHPPFSPRLHPPASALGRLLLYAYLDQPQHHPQSLLLHAWMLHSIQRASINQPLEMGCFGYVVLTHLRHAVSSQVSCAVPAATHAVCQVSLAAAAWHGHGVLVGWRCGTAVLVLPLKCLHKGQTAA